MKGKLKMAKLTLICLFVTLVMAGGLQAVNAAEKGPIKIGYVAPFTGPFAQAGLEMVSGFKMAMDEVNYTVAGRKIELIVEDEAGNPDVTISKVRKLITNDKVNMIAGVVQGNISYAVAPITTKEEIPFVNTVSTGDDLTQRKRSKYFIRIGWTGGMLGHVAGDYTYKKWGWRRVATIGMDYSWGYENIGGFQRVFEELGGKVIQKVWAPIGTMDFAPYIASLKRDADGIFDVVTGGPGIRFMKALRGSGLLDKVKLFICGAATDETFLPAIGDDAIGVYGVWPYSVVLDNPENKKFVEMVKTSYKMEPTGVIAITYIVGNWVVRAMKAVNGDVENKEKFMEALRAVEMPNSVYGPLKLDKYGQSVSNMYIRRVDKVGNRLQNTVVDTYPMVSQFWKYDPETYLKSPLYTRDYPPCKFCE